MSTMPMARLLVVAGVCALASGVRPLAWSAAGLGLTGSVRTHVVARGETLTSIGARFGVTTDALRHENALQAGATLAVGQLLRVDDRHIIPAAVAPGVIIINLPQRLLFHHDGEVITALPAAVGRRTWPTPIGSFTIVSKEENPTWDVPASILEEARRAGRTLPPSIPPGPDNPLGQFWLGLSGGSIGIHGTNAPSSIYQTATHGCVRLHPDDIAWLFPRVAIASAVRTIYEPVLLAATRDDVFLEVHPDAYRRVHAPLATAQTLAAAAGLTERVDWAAATTVIAARHGIARAVTLQSKGVNP
jgi:L,D-transpeptidase ErfK/SrfK